MIQVSSIALTPRLIILMYLCLIGCSSASYQPATQSQRNPAHQPSINTPRYAHMHNLPVTLVSLQTGSMARFTANVTMPMSGAARYSFLTGLALLDRRSFALLGAYVNHSAIKLMNSKEQSVGIVFENVPKDAPSGETWWPSDLINAEFGTTTGSIRKNGIIVMDFSEDGESDKTWIPYSPQTYAQWWTQIECEYHPLELFSDDKPIKEEGVPKMK